MLTWNQENLFIGQPKEAASNSVLLWNIALDQNHGPNIAQQYPDGRCPPSTACGCETCRGLLTLTETGFEKNVDLWAVAHSSAFVKPGARRLETTTQGDVIGTAYRNPNGEIVVVGHAKYWDGSKDLNIEIDGKFYFIPNFGKEASITMVKHT